jgi:hypothetical protein
MQTACLHKRLQYTEFTVLHRIVWAKTRANGFVAGCVDQSWINSGSTHTVECYTVRIKLRRIACCLLECRVLHYWHITTASARCIDINQTVWRHITSPKQATALKGLEIKPPYPLKLQFTFTPSPHCYSVLFTVGGTHLTALRGSWLFHAPWKRKQNLSAKQC